MIGAIIAAASAASAALLDVALLRDSALPLSGKRILLAAPRTEAAPLASSLVLAGGRPLWCPGVRMEPLDEYGELDDALMRLTEYDVLITLCRHSIDAIAARWLSLADGDLDVVKAMLDASSVELGAVGADALHMRRRLGVPATVVPIEPSATALADTLCDLGHVKPGARVLLACGHLEGAPGDELPAAAASCLRQLRADGADAERVTTHRIVPDVASPEAAMGVDALCAGSVEELRALAAASDARLPEVVCALQQYRRVLAKRRRRLRTDAVRRIFFFALGGVEHMHSYVAVVEWHSGHGHCFK